MSLTMSRKLIVLLEPVSSLEKNLFLSLGGFDESFAPAFYEEFDFAFTLRQMGYKIIYQPASCILHFGSSSSRRRVKGQTIIHKS